MVKQPSLGKREGAYNITYVDLFKGIQDDIDFLQTILQLREKNGDEYFIGFNLLNQEQKKYYFKKLESYKKKLEFQDIYEYKYVISELEKGEVTLLTIFLNYSKEYFISSIDQWKHYILPYFKSLGGVFVLGFILLILWEYPIFFFPFLFFFFLSYVLQIWNIAILYGKVIKDNILFLNQIYKIVLDKNLMYLYPDTDFTQLNMKELIFSDKTSIYDMLYISKLNKDIRDHIAFLVNEKLKYESALKHLRIKKEQMYEDNQKIIESIDELSPYEFEKVVSKIFNNLGFQSELTKGSNDGGVDVLIRKGHEVGVIQCKKYSGVVSPSHIRDLIGTTKVLNANIGILVTTGTVSKKTIEMANQHNIKIYDMKQMKNFLDHCLKINSNAKFDEIF